MAKTHLATIAWLIAALSISSCWFKKPPVVFTPPPVAAQPPIPEATPLPPPPGDIVAATPEGPPSTPLSIPKVPGPPTPQPTKRPPVAATPKAPTVPPSTDSPAPTLPRLGQILTQDQEREYNRTIDESLGRVKAALARVEGKRLNRQQSDAVSRIRSFQKQAEQARERDLVTAVNLARRVDLLAKDLFERLP